MSHCNQGPRMIRDEGWVMLEGNPSRKPEVIKSWTEWNEYNIQYKYKEYVNVAVTNSHRFVPGLFRSIGMNEHAVCARVITVFC